MLDVKDISKSIKGKKIVSKVNIEINKSDIFGLLGPNGAGKTTTFYIIAGLMNPDDIASNYLWIHNQPRNAWTHELDLRPWVEKW